MLTHDEVISRATAAPEESESTEDSSALMQRMRNAFREAVGGGTAEVRDGLYTFAGRPVRLRVVGGRLAERTHRAFGHLKRTGEADGRPTLTIDLWDETETSILGPPATGAPDIERQWVACGGALAASPDGRYVSFRYQDSVTVLDRHAQRMIGCRRGGSHMSTGEYSKPLLLLLSIWYYDRGVQLLHAGLIASNGAGVLLPGESGTGKSTTSLASLTQGLEYLGDDFIGLERAGNDEFCGHAVFNTVCIARENLGRFPDLRAHAVDDGFSQEDKPILFLSEIYPDRLRTTVPIRAIVLLRIRSERTEIRPARRAEALRAFAASTLHTVVPRPGREALEMLGAVVERVPAFWLLLGPELRDIAPSIERIVSNSVVVG